MKKLLKIILLVAMPMVCRGQYDFERYPAILFKEYKNWKTYDRLESRHKLDHTLAIPKFFSDSSAMTIQFTILEQAGHSEVRIFKDKEQVQKLLEKDAFYGLTEPENLFVADFNNDGLFDIKLIIPNHGCGAYNYYCRIIYLLQNKDEKFTKISFTDLLMDFQNRPERDVDGDGNFEIVTQTFQRVKNHTYWVFNLYNFNDNSLINVNSKLGYPIMTQLLYRENYKITNNISRSQMKNFARKLPDDYVEN